jgi:putative hydrolase of the HAD superfamily
MIKAIFWDFGGVLTTGPFGAFKRFEQENNLPENFIRMVNATNPDTNAWAKLERSEINLVEFDRAFEEETRHAGHPIGGFQVLQLIAGDLVPDMVEVLRQCKRHFPNACLTNNINIPDHDGDELAGDRADEFKKVMALFDYVVESSKVGVRKPDPYFYEMACEIVKVEPQQVVFLDDLGVNLKPARAMGMKTIKVADHQEAIKALEAILGIEFSL